MGDIATLLTAIGGLVTALAGAFALVYNTVRIARREPRAAAENAAQRMADELVAAAEDGQLTAEEIATALQHLQREEGQA